MEQAKNIDYVAAIVEGNSGLFKQMHRELFPMIRKFVMDNSGAEEEAKDVFQYGVMKVYEKAKYEPGFVLTSKFSTFLFSICHKYWLNVLRKRKKEVLIDVTNPNDPVYKMESDWEPEFGSLSWERRKLFNKAFAQLGEQCQKLLLLFFEKKKMQEIAEALGIKNTDTATKRKERCQKKLINLVKSYPEYLELNQTQRIKKTIYLLNIQPLKGILNPESFRNLRYNIEKKSYTQTIRYNRIQRNRKK